MKDAKLAEFLLRRTTGAEQAAAQVGDMLELAEQHGKLWFWRSVFGTLARRSWRGVLAVAIAYAVSELSSRVLSAGGDIRHFVLAGDVYRISAGLALVGLGSTWTMIAAYAAVRFGARNQLARVASALSAALWLYLCLAWREMPWAGLAVVPALAYALLGQHGRWRRPILGLLVILPLEFAFFLLSGAVFFLVVHAIGGPTVLFTHPANIPRLSFLFIFRVIQIAEFVVSLSGYLWVYRWLMRTRNNSQGAAPALIE